MAGAIAAIWYAPHTFTEDEQYLYYSSLQTLATVVAARRATIKADLTQGEIARRAIALEIITGVSADITSILETDKLLQTACETASYAFKLHFTVYMLDGVDNLVQVAMHDPYFKPSTSVEEITVLPVSTSTALPAQAIREGKLKQNNKVNDPSRPSVRSELAIPMTVSNHTFGVLSIQHDTTKSFR